MGLCFSDQVLCVMASRSSEEILVCVNSAEEFNLAMRMMSWLRMPYRKGTELDAEKLQFYLYDESDCWILKRMLSEQGVTLAVKQYTQ